jgi:protein-arginine deiminase
MRTLTSSKSLLCPRNGERSLALRGTVGALAAMALSGLLGVACDGEGDPSGDAKDAVPARIANLIVDADRDGDLDDDDDAVEDEQAAVFLANVDDDNRDGQRDRQDSPLDPADEDMTELLVRRVRRLQGARVFLTVEPALAQQRTRIWQGNDVLLDAETDRAEVVGLDSGDAILRLEALTGRTADWDGFVILTLTIEEAADDENTMRDDDIVRDVARLRAAPVLFPDNLQTPRQLFVVDIRQGADNNRAFLQALRTQPALPRGVDLYVLNGMSYFLDRWVQDSWEIGTQLVPQPGGVREMITALQLERDYGGQGLDAFVPDEWLSPGRGYFYPAGEPSSHNYGGNLEVSPPTALHPFGRILYGGGTTKLSGARNVDTMNEAQVNFLNAQELQGPALELSSEWLAVGHIDEFFQFVPDLDGGGAHPFVVVLSSPALARDALLAAQQDGHGDAVVFAGRASSITVDEILQAEDFLALNEAAQGRIDDIQARMKQALGLVDDDFRYVPVLYEEVDGDGLVAAFNPGIQNLVVVGDRLFVPDPEGPVIDGVDVWQEATTAALADTALDVVFVDIFESYHELLGEAHCGTNVERAPWSMLTDPATAWWNSESN